MALLKSLYGTSTSAIIFLILVTLQQGECSGDCAELKLCMSNKGATERLPDLQITNTTTVRPFYKAFCRNLDIIIDCFSPLTFGGCSATRGYFNYIPTKQEETIYWTRTCSDLNGLFAAFVCIMMPNVFSGLQHCVQQTLHYVTNSTISELCQSPFFDEYYRCLLPYTYGFCTGVSVNALQNNLNLEEAALCSSVN